MSKTQDKFFSLVEEERKRQDDLWGQQEHEDQIWAAILMGEVGDLYKVMLHADLDAYDESLDNELVHIAAVLKAMYECRQKELGLGD